MPTVAAPWIELGVALGIGLLIGLERERRKGEGARRIAAGIRTFAVASLLGAAAAWVGGAALVVAAVLGVAALAVVAYLRSRAADPGVTTGVALILTVVLGGLATTQPALAAALAVVLAVLLASRPRLHHFVQRVLTDSEVDDGLMLAAATLVVLPMIPAGYLGPFDAVSPRTAWTLVILMLLVGALGHVARRALGAGLGLAAAGFASGFVSSAATIAAMGERAAREPALLRATVAGAVLSSVATVIQMAILLAATSPATLRALAAPLAASGLVAAGYAGLYTWRSLHEKAGTADAAGHAFSLRRALGLAALLSAVMVASAALQAAFGSRGVVAAATLAGLADTHSAAAAVASLVAAGKLPVDAAPVAVLCALTSNALTKLVVAWSGGSRRFFAQVAPGLVLMIGAAWLALGMSR
jgi:uncharacterized membrane protein (DUF4010 family)